MKDQKKLERVGRPLMKVEVINNWTCATEFESNFWNKLINHM